MSRIESEDFAESVAFLSLLMEARFDEALVDEERASFDDFLKGPAKEAGGFVIGLETIGDDPFWIRYRIGYDVVEDGKSKFGITEPIPYEDTFLGSAYPKEWGELSVFM